MSTWDSVSLSGVRDRSLRGDSHLRDDVRDSVLRKAEELVSLRGLTVSLSHLNFDEVIALSGVPRTTAYRVWPRKERFLEDLLRRLADTCSPCGGALDEAGASAALAALERLSDHLDTPEGRRLVLVEVCRVASQRYFECGRSSPTWLTYLALIATMRSLGDDSLSQEIRDRMRRAETKAVALMAATYETVAGVVGYRLRSLPGSFTALTHLGAAASEGMLLLADIRPDASARLGEIDPFLTGRLAEWSLPAIGYASTVLGLLEPDPAFDLAVARARLAEHSLRRQDPVPA